MPEYKLYRLDGAKRIARAADVLSADCDEQAVAAARRLAKTGSCEIWQGRRLVATIPADSTANGRSPRSGLAANRPDERRQAGDERG